MTIVMDVMATYEDFELRLPVPVSARLPIELEPPDGFDPYVLGTWPKVEGRLEYVDGRLLYMPPCGRRQGTVALRVGQLCLRWKDLHPGYEVDGNEIGIVLGKDVRAADVAVWARPDRSKPLRDQFATVPPLLAIEVAGRRDAEDEAALLRKGKAYLKRGVKTVWLVLPETREVLVLRADRTRRFEHGEVVPTPPELPGLVVTVQEIFQDL